VPTAFCPHCLLTVAEDAAPGFPPAPMRCPHCRLSIAATRARLHVGEDGAVPASGSAAGILANAARREDAPKVDDAEVVRALRHVADAAGSSVGRLRMIDYQRIAAPDPTLPSVASIVECCGGWKRAHQLAASR
jgi:hypothetical protein